jgi:LCP family protein required for cell wall assembly
MRYPDLKSKNKIKNKKTASSKSKVTRYVLVFLVIVTVGLLSLFLFTDTVRALLSPVSIVATINGAELEETDGRTNVLLIGSDRRSTSEMDSPERADTILVASIGRLDNNIVLISVPRDLWVSSDVPGCGECKISEVYAHAYYSSSPPEEVLQETVESVLGIPIHYYAVVNFDLFVDVIDTLGGVTVNVERSFDDYSYPVEGKEADTCGRSQEEIDQMVEEELPFTQIFPCRYKHVSFESGEQEMDGETALQFVRSRKGTNGENTDFARSARQQKIIMALKSKATSLKTLINPKKLGELFSLYKDNVSTNIDFATLQDFYLLSEQLNFEGVRTIVLDDRSMANQGGLLISPMDKSLYGGKYVLLPRSGDYSQVRAYVQRFLFGE